MISYCTKCQKIVKAISMMKRKLNNGKIVYEGKCEVCGSLIRKKG
jgi:hypothetical protein